MVQKQTLDSSINNNDQQADPADEQSDLMEEVEYSQANMSSHLQNEEDFEIQLIS